MLALIGPSGCGKTTLLRTLNRLTELTPTARRGGRILLDGRGHRRARGHRSCAAACSMVFQQPNPFPMSIFDNVAYALREQARSGRRKRVVEPQVDRRAAPRRPLRRGQATTSTIPRCASPAASSSGCASPARSRSSPRCCCIDEPCSALDPISTEVIEELIGELRRDLAIVIVTHNLQQAYRVADHVAFMYLGDLVEYGPTEQVFGAPRAERTRDYVRGAFG